MITSPTEEDNLAQQQTTTDPTSQPAQQLPVGQVDVRDIFIVMKTLADVSQQNRLKPEEIEFVKPAFERLDKFLKTIEQNNRMQMAKSVVEQQTDLLELPNISSGE